MNERTVIFASPKDGKLPKTLLRLYTELQNRGVPVYSVDCRNADILDDGRIEGKFAKSDNRQTIAIDPARTACVVSNGIATTRSARDFVSDLEDMGVHIVNSLEGIDNARNKEIYDRICKKKGIPTPKTKLVNSPSDLESVLPNFNFPVVCKTCTGSFGVGVFKADKPNMVKPIFQTLWKMTPSLRETGILIQEYVPNGGDVRTIVVGGKIVGSMLRKAKEGDFRNNYSQGGTVEEYNLSEKEKNVVLQAARESGCEICGVDHIVGPDGNPYVIEVNSCPGTDGFLQIHPDAIEKMADFVLDMCGQSTRTSVIGTQETIDIEEVGQMDAQLDLNGRDNSVLHAEEVDVNDDYVSFKTNGKTVRLPISDFKTYDVNGERHKVPVVELSVKLGRTTIPHVHFELMSRKSCHCPVLLSNACLSGGKFVIDPAKKNITSLNESVEETGVPDAEEKVFLSELSDEALVALFSLSTKKKDKFGTPEATEELEWHGYAKDGKITDEGWAYLLRDDIAERLVKLKNGN